jgi:hypothetical protein
LAGTPVPKVATTVENTPVPDQTALIAGVVVDGATGRPIPGALVNVNANRIPGVFTDAIGRFVFPAIPAATYDLTATKAGYATADSPRSNYRVQAADSRRLLNIRIKLWRLASVSGAVTDERGDPIVRAEVFAFRWIANGDAATPTRVGVARTDDRGMYRIFELPPADYIIGAAQKDLPSIGDITALSAATTAVVASRSQMPSTPAAAELMVGPASVFPPRFYPASQSFRDATTLRLAPGDDRTGIDIVLASRRVVPVSGVVSLNADRLTLRAEDFRLTPVVDGEPVTGLATYVLDDLLEATGAFTFKAVPYGTYLLTAANIANVEIKPTGRRRVDIADQLPYWASLPVTVGGDGIAGLQLVMRPGVRVGGFLNFVGAPRPTAELLENFRLVFWPLTDRAQMGGARLEADASFSVRGMVPGAYTTDFQGDATGLHVKSFVAGGVDVTDLPFVVGTEPVGDVQITLVGAADYASILGNVRQSAGAPEDISVFLFPADRRLWSDPRAAGRRFKAIAATESGAFAISDLVPGEYLIAASAEPVTSNWRSTARLDAMSRMADRIVLSPGEKRAITLVR